MPVDWHQLTALVDAAVDDKFGEPIKFIPWSKGDGYVEGMPDWDRVIADAVGCYVSPKARVAQPPGGFTAPMANTDLLFSVRTMYIIGLQQGDHVELAQREGTYEVAYITPGDTDRSILHLLRLKEPPL